MRRRLNCNNKKLSMLGIGFSQEFFYAADDGTLAPSSMRCNNLNLFSTLYAFYMNNCVAYEQKVHANSVWFTSTYLSCPIIRCVCSTESLKTLSLIDVQTCAPYIRFPLQTSPVVVVPNYWGLSRLTTAMI